MNVADSEVVAAILETTDAEIAEQWEDADIVILDPSAHRLVSVETQVSRCDYAPLEGMELSCAIAAVYLRGTLVAEDGRVVCENQGRYVKRGLPEYF